MLGSLLRRRLLSFALLPLVAACSSAVKTQVKTTPAAQVPVRATAAATQAPVTSVAAGAQTAPVEDPVLALIAVSERHFTAGQTELQQGHFEAAKQEFNKSIEVLLESTYGGRTEPRIREHFD